MTNLFVEQQTGSSDHLVRVMQYISTKLKQHMVFSTNGLFCTHATSADYDDLNNEIDMLEFARIQETVLLTILRTTFSVRKDLPSWASWVQKTKTELEIRGLDSRKLLRGLLPPDQV